MDKQDLIAFTEEIAALFEAGEIRAPVHLGGGSEDGLIEVFRDVRPNDWVFATHRSMYAALLKGVPKELVKEEILAGHSMHLNFKEYNFFTSAIVGGCLPIAAGDGVLCARVRVLFRPPKSEILMTRPLGNAIFSTSCGNNHKVWG